LLALLLPQAAAQTAATEAERAEAIERERARSTIQRALAMTVRRIGERAGGHDDFMTAVDQVLELGPSAGEFLIPEFDSLSADRFFFSVYVAGRLGLSEAVEPLRETLREADAEGSELGRRRKAWCAIGLAMLGQTDVLDILDDGNTPAARTEMSKGMTTIELAAMLLGPQKALPVLLAQIERYGKNPVLRDRRFLSIRALARLGDPSVVPKLLELLDDDSLVVQVEVIRALAVLGSGKQVLAPLLALLEHPNERIRKAVILALEQFDANPAQFTALLARLETEDHPFVRSVIYRMAARRVTARTPELFRGYWGSPNRFDRMWLAEAAGAGGDPRLLNLLRETLRDEDAAVRLRAVQSIGAIGGGGALDTLLASLRNSDWTVRLTALEQLVEAGDRRAAPRVADLLLNTVLPRFDVRKNDRHRAGTLAAALVSFGYTDVLEDLRKVAPGFHDAETREVLLRTVKQLEWIGTLDQPAWIDALDDADSDLRGLAIDRLAHPADGAPAALVAAFDDADDADRLRILHALAHHPAAAAADLAERVLVEPEYDLAVRAPLRDAGAWLARRVDGERMERALRSSVVRREGRDYKVLVYFAVLAGGDALDVLREVALRRVRYPHWHRGLQQDKLQWIIRRLSEGLDAGPLDLEPARLEFPG
jgi:HEAT repeat protein